ncbi:c-terminal processing peptidase [Clostridium sp. CAG:433]|nr:c-terminal processing peptidase [Clostridium sp. CAG:433]
MANNAKKYIKLAILAVVSMIIGSVITIAIKDFDVAKVNTNKTEVSYSKTKKGFDSLYETYDTIMSEYYKDVDSDKLIEGAINGMLESLDDEHTMYFDKKSKEEFDSELSGNYYGIGAQIQLTSDETIKITKVFDDSPAKKAGLKEEDVFVSVDGTSVKGKSATEVANMLKSDSVKTSTIVVKRNDKELTFKVTKENITLFSVSSEMLDNNGKNVGYLSVSIFGQKTYSQFKDALTKLEKQDMDSLIIDLRGNTGGYLSTVTNMLEEFIDKGNVIYQIQSSSGVKQYKTVKASDKKYKIVVLIDGGSASASEIMSAAMKEVYGATLVGQTTYGKGTVQTTKDLSNGSMIKYTIEKWLTPSGKNIDKEGIKPDYEVELGDSYKNNPTKENDAQLQKALDLLK